MAWACNQAKGVDFWPDWGSWKSWIDRLHFEGRMHGGSGWLYVSARVAHRGYPLRYPVKSFICPTQAAGKAEETAGCWAVRRRLLPPPRTLEMIWLHGYAAVDSTWLNGAGPLTWTPVSMLAFIGWVGFEMRQSCFVPARHLKDVSGWQTDISDWCPNRMLYYAPQTRKWFSGG